MDPKMIQVFEPLKAQFMGGPYSPESVFELIGGFAETSPPIALALCLHMRDYVQEQQGKPYEMNVALCEIYRRTFFDAATAELYGTGDIANSGPEVLAQFVSMLSGNLKMDEAVSSQLFPEQQQNHSH